MAKTENIVKVEVLQSAVPTEKVLLAIDADIANREAELEGVVIDSDVKYNAWTTTATTWNQTVKWIDGERLALGKPVREFIKTHIDAPFTERLTKMRGLFAILKTRLATYHDEQEKKRLAELAKAEKERLANLARQEKLSQKPPEERPAVKEPAKPLPLATRLAGKMTTRWYAEPVNIDEIPREWLLNEDGTPTGDTLSRLNRVVRRAENPVRYIPGVKIYSKQEATY